MNISNSAVKKNKNFSLPNIFQAEQVQTMHLASFELQITLAGVIHGKND
jgi:hypothetical protein